MDAETVSKVLDERFRAVLEDLPVPKAEVARDLDVNPGRVTEWSNGERTPTLDEMNEVVRFVRGVLERKAGALSEAERGLRVLHRVGTAEGRGEVQAARQALVREFSEEATTDASSAAVGAGAEPASAGWGF